MKTYLVLISKNILEAGERIDSYTRTSRHGLAIDWFKSLDGLLKTFLEWVYKNALNDVEEEVDDYFESLLFSMAVQQHKPIRMGFPPLFTSLTRSVFRKRR